MNWATRTAVTATATQRQGWRAGTTVSSPSRCPGVGGSSGAGRRGPRRVDRWVDRWSATWRGSLDAVVAVVRGRICGGFRRRGGRDRRGRAGSPARPGRWRRSAAERGSAGTGAVKAPLLRAVVNGPSAKRRGCGRPSRSTMRLSPGSTESRPCVGDGGPALVQGAQQRAGGVAERGVRQAGLDQGAGLDVLAGDGGAARPARCRAPRRPPRRWRRRGSGRRRPGEGEELLQAGAGRARCEVAEEAVPPVADVAEPDELGVGQEQPEEDCEIRAVVRVVTACQVGGSCSRAAFLERLGAFVRRHAVEIGPVERVQVEPVGGVGYGTGDEVGQFGAAEDRRLRTSRRRPRGPGRCARGGR
ncbi:hypothetical protein SVIOM74S_02607 [Streptomyces violarus]